MCEYYEMNAKRYVQETFSADMSEQYKRFLPLLGERARILDVGSGSGRDACYFQNHGYQVTALEPSKNLCRELRKVFSGEMVYSDIQRYLPDQRFDGIWACASLLHLQEKEIYRFFEKNENLCATIYVHLLIYSCNGQLMVNGFLDLEIPVCHSDF